MKNFALAIALLSALLVACSGSDDDTSSAPSGGSAGSGAAGSGGSSSSTCSGNVTECAPATLSSEQITTMCDTLAAAVLDPAGTKYECKSGTHAGLYLVVSDRPTCISTWPKSAGCSITGKMLISCYKDAKADACTAFDGSCKFTLDETLLKACSK